MLWCHIIRVSALNTDYANNLHFVKVYTITDSEVCDARVRAIDVRTRVKTVIIQSLLFPDRV